MSELDETQREAVKVLEEGRKLLADHAGSRWGGAGVRRGSPGVQHLATAIADPAAFWSLAAAGSLGGECGGAAAQATAVAMATAIKAAAVRLKVGDFGPIREALIGQAGWLAATAVKLMAAADAVEPGYKSHEKQAELIRLALRASDSSAKVLASATALSAIAVNGGGGACVAEQ